MDADVLNLHMISFFRFFQITYFQSVLIFKYLNAVVLVDWHYNSNYNEVRIFSTCISSRLHRPSQPYLSYM